MREYEIKQEQKIIDSNNAGGFYRFVNAKLSCKRGIGALKKDNGDVGLTDVERANLLNDYFASVTVKDNGSMPVFDRVVPDDAKIESVDFTIENVFAAIKKLKAGGSSGPDGFPLSCLRSWLALLRSRCHLYLIRLCRWGRFQENGRMQLSHRFTKADQLLVCRTIDRSH